MTPGATAEPNEVVILSVVESGAVDGWEWVATLKNPGTDNRTLELEQVPWVRDPEWMDTHFVLEPVVSGAELFEFMESHWSDAHCEGLSEEQWDYIVQEIGKVDPVLAGEVRQAVKDEFDLEPPPVESEQEAFEEFLQKATFEKTSFGGGGAMWAGLAENMRAADAIAFYCRRYREQHGRLPQGTHRVTVTFGDVQNGADLPPPRRGGMQTSGSSRFDKEVTFPDS